MNESPYDAWMVKIKVEDTSVFGEFLSPEDYKKYCEKEA
jgi:glycine cleavage system H lipoate-binding protein